MIVLASSREEADLSSRVATRRNFAARPSHHNDPAPLAVEEMLAAVTSFLDQWLAGR
jgi:hypothetical protein